MAAIKLIRAKKPDMPKWLVTLYGPSGVGKTLLVAQLPGSKLVFDADGRFMEQAAADDEIYFAYETAAETMKIANITQALLDTMPGSDIANIIIDTMTTPFQQLNDDVEAMPKSGPGSREAKTHKAKIMKALRRALFGYNKNVAVIFHTHLHGDGMSSNTTEAKTLSDIELARFDMCTNMTLRVVIDERTNKRGVIIERNRFGHTGLTVWDESGNWTGFWEKLQTEAYKGLTWTDMNRIAASTPASFADKPAAWAWAMEQGCFKDVAHARSAMAKMERETEIEPDDLWSAWIANVMGRKANVTATTFASADQAIDWGVAQGAFATLEASKAAYQALRTEKAPKSAKEMFGLWIHHVTSIKDAPPQEPAQAAEVITEPVAAEAPTTVPAVPVFDWLTGNLTPQMKEYAAVVQAARNGTVVSPAQVANLRHVISQTAGWDDETTQLGGLPKADWIANLLADRGGDPLDSYPAGAAKLIYTQLIQTNGDKRNAKYSADRAAIVKEIAGIVDQAVSVYR